MKAMHFCLLAILSGLALNSVTSADGATRATTPPPDDAAPPQAVDQLIVQFVHVSTAYLNSQAAAAVIQHALQAAATAPSARSSNPGATLAPLTATIDHRLATGADVVTLSAKVDAEQANAILQALRAEPAVEYVEIDGIVKPSLIPNDTMFSQQWSLQTAPAAIDAPSAWNRSLGNGVTVAVIDTGIISHPDLDAKVLPGYDFISKESTAGDGDKRDKTPRDEGDYCSDELGHVSRLSSWHGSHVAGIIAAATNNAQGIAGIAPGANVVPVRALGRCGGRDSDIIDAIYWAAGESVKHAPDNHNPAQIINMSLGGGGPCGKSMQKAIDMAATRHVLVVTAAGNNNGDAASIYPANCRHVLTVTATDANGNRAAFSNYGTRVDISAPGTSIQSTVDAGLLNSTGPSYAARAGTSMAAPAVAGVAALLYGLAPPNCHGRLQTDDVVQILKDTATPLIGNCPNGCGRGIVNAGAAVNAGYHTLTSPEVAIYWYVSDYTVTVDPQISGCELNSDPIAHAVVDFGDGIASTTLSTSHTYAEPGTYGITITITTQSGNVVVKSESVYVSGHDST